MEIGQNTVQIEGKMDGMERNLSKNGIFTYTSPSEELDHEHHPIFACPVAVIAVAGIKRI
jgi:hypothetical protein